MPLDPTALGLALRLGAEARLAVYGSLRPGEQHHDLVDDLTVVAMGTVPGRLARLDGYPVLAWHPGGEPVPVTVLAGPALPARWRELDAFEGPAYHRDLVVVDLDGGGLLVAMCYLASGE